MLIDCDTCVVRDLHCDDCVVSVFLALPRVAIADRGDGFDRVDRVDRLDRVELDDPERAAVQSLVAAGLVPPLRLVALSAPPDPIGASHDGLRCSSV